MAHDAVSAEPLRGFCGPRAHWRRADADDVFGFALPGDADDAQLLWETFTAAGCCR